MSEWKSNIRPGLEEGWGKVGVARCEKRGQGALVKGLWWKSEKRKSEQ